MTTPTTTTKIPAIWIGDNFSWKKQIAIMAKRMVESEFHKTLETAKPKYFIEKAKDNPEIPKQAIPKTRSSKLLWIVHSLIKVEEITSIIAVMEIKTHAIFQ